MPVNTFFSFIFPKMINQSNYKGIASYDWVAIIYSTNYLFYSADDCFAHTKL